MKHLLYGEDNTEVPRNTSPYQVSQNMESNLENYQNGVLRKLKHIFPNTYQRIKSICSPAKGGTGCYRFNYQPGS